MFNKRDNTDTERYEYNINDDSVKKAIAIVMNDIGVKSNEKKAFYKSLFKQYDKFISGIDEEIWDTFHLFYTIPEIEKIIYFLRYRQDANYRDKIKAIKSMYTGNMLDLIRLEKFLLSHLNQYMKFVDSNINDFIKGASGEPYTEQETRAMLHHAVIYLNTVLIIKCATEDYGLTDISYITSDNKLIKKRHKEPKRILFSGNFDLVLADESKIDELEIYRILKKQNDSFYNSYLNNTNPMEFISSIHEDVIGIMVNTINYRQKYDEYTKLLLREKYNEYVMDRITDTSKLIPDVFPVFLLPQRKVLLPKSGVIMLIEDNPCIESILLKEIYDEGTNHLLAVTRYKDGTECTNSIVLEYNGPIIYDTFYVSENEDIANRLTTIDYIVDFYKLVDDVELKYEVIAPSYWKYRTKKYTSSIDTVGKLGTIITRAETVEIAPFIRKVNGYASDEAVSLGKKLGLSLDVGFTVVRPHTRTYNKRI